MVSVCVLVKKSQYGTTKRRGAWSERLGPWDHRVSVARGQPSLTVWVRGPTAMTVQAVPPDWLGPPPLCWCILVMNTLRTLSTAANHSVFCWENPAGQKSLIQSVGSQRVEEIEVMRKTTRAAI